VPLKREHLLVNVVLGHHISVTSELTVKYTIRINIEGVKVQEYIPLQAIRI
jgi:hypothetical protein